MSTSRQGSGPRDTSAAEWLIATIGCGMLIASLISTGRLGASILSARSEERRMENVLRAEAQKRSERTGGQAWLTTEDRDVLFRYRFKTILAMERLEEWGLRLIVMAAVGVSAMTWVWFRRRGSGGPRSDERSSVEKADFLRRLQEAGTADAGHDQAPASEREQR